MSRSIRICPFNFLGWFYLQRKLELNFLLNIWVGGFGPGFGKFQLGMLMYTGLAWLADAAEMILLSFIGPSVTTTYLLYIYLHLISSVVLIYSTSLQYIYIFQAILFCLLSVVYMMRIG
jgi:hypothetical protein